MWNWPRRSVMVRATTSVPCMSSTSAPAGGMHARERRTGRCAVQAWTIRRSDERRSARAEGACGRGERPALEIELTADRSGDVAVGDAHGGRRRGEEPRDPERRTFEMVVDRLAGLVALGLDVCGLDRPVVGKQGVQARNDPGRRGIVQ